MTRRVLITGASRGFGAALAGAFARRGALVFAGSRGPSPKLSELVQRHAAQVVELGLDVTSAESVRDAVTKVSQSGPGLDVLVNNAAIRSASVVNPLETVDFDDMRLSLEVNAIAPLRVIQGFLPLLRQGSKPVLVNVSSEAGSIGQCWRKAEFDYCMSKAALNMATKLVANYVGAGLRVFALHPGWLRTDMGGANAELDPDATAELVAELIEREAGNAGGPEFMAYDGATLPW
jgi:NAD(P)-dependent dehydrogenase (short-subunit alcohol dehydrogenase family)